MEVKSIMPPPSRAPKRAVRGGNINVIRSLVIAATLAAPDLAQPLGDVFRGQGHSDQSMMAGKEPFDEAIVTTHPLTGAGPPHKQTIIAKIAIVRF